jgi:serine/threonine-protein kinase
MAEDPRVRQFLEHILDTGCSAEEACRSSPELLPQVHERLRRLRAIEAEVGELFPNPDSTRDGRVTQSTHSTWDLPQIPGYAVQKVLGRGGMGIVFKAWDLRLHRIVALKMLLVGDCATSLERERFLREAEAKAGLSHSNIVQVYEVGEHNGRPYFTMEFVEGGNLAEKLQNIPQPAREAAALVATLAEAVQAAHQSGVVHRDLKPANVLLAPDGTPKISDFGLARRMENAALLTQSGVAIGTPSYMAPEQARGQSRAIGPATDVYSLGAILYESLTGRPPFRAETSPETLQQVIYREPVRPSRLNARVPRDLETITLKCLDKEPVRRYPTALALAADLRRFLRGEPVAARPLGRLPRLLRWLRRHPSLALLVFMALALTGLAGAAAAREWALAEKRRAEAAKSAAGLENALQLLRLGLLSEASAALTPVSDAGSDGLRERCAQARSDLALAQELESIHLNQTVVAMGLYNLRANKDQADRAYDSAFTASGLGGVDDDPKKVAARVSASNIGPALVAALDQWSICTSDPRRREWLLEIARQADPLPTVWANRVRDPTAWQNRTVLAELAGSAPVGDQTVQLLLALAERLQYVGADSIRLLRKVQQKHADDFWANFALGNALKNTNRTEAVRYYQAALALRPRAPVVLNNLGVALALTGRTDEAIDQFQQALDIDPGFAAAHNDMGNALQHKGLYEKAVDHYKRSLLIADTAAAHNDLGAALIMLRRTREGIEHFRLAIRLDPRSGGAHVNLGRALVGQGLVDEAIDHYRKALALDARDANAHAYLGIALTDQGQIQEAIDHLQRALRIDPKLAHAHGGLGEAFLAIGKYREAQAATRRALDLAPSENKLAAKQLQQCEHWLALEARLAAVLRGEDKPVDAAESLDFAEMCRHRKLRAAAARFSAAGFAACPQLASAWKTARRYNAACDAALAGCGRSDDAVALSETERARWRKQACAWLQADLDEFIKAWATALASDRPFIRKVLPLWQVDPDLAGLRETSALEKLSPDEREKCLVLWKQVAALLGRVQTTE